MPMFHKMFVFIPEMETQHFTKFVTHVTFVKKKKSNCETNKNSALLSLLAQKTSHQKNCCLPSSNPQKTCPQKENAIGSCSPGLGGGREEVIESTNWGHNNCDLGEHLSIAQWPE